MHHLSAMAFLPADKIPGTFNELKPHLPKKTTKVTDGFENYYVHGRIRRHILSQAWWLTPAISALWEARQADHLGLGVQDHQTTW